MVSVVLPLVLLLATQKVTVRIGDEPKADSLPYDSLARRHDRRPARRIPLTPELEASAFKDPGARVLLLKARDARMRQDSALLSYDATAYQRISAGLGFRAFGRNRLLFRTENASRVRWSRDGGAHIDLKGLRSAIPMVKDGDAEVDIDEVSPIPYFPGREALWIGSDVAKAEVDDRELVHPIALGAEAYYRYASGDSVIFRLSDGKTIRLQELRIAPRRPNWRLSVGSFWFDASSGQLVRAAYRLSVPMDIWQVAKEEAKDERENRPNRKNRDDDPPGWVVAMMSPMTANLESVTIEYGLYGGRFWLPRVQSAEGSAQASFMRVPFKMEESFKYASVNGVDSLPKIPPAPKSLRDSLFGPDSARWRDLTPEQRRDRAKEIARADSSRRERNTASRKRQCDSSGTWERYENRHNGAVRVAVRIPCDSTVLAHSPDLPPSIYEPGEELFGMKERDELLKALDFSLQPEWAPQRPTLHYGLDLTRYNRVEGFSAGFNVKEDLGRGYRLDFTPRFGFSDLQPNADLSLSRSDGRNQMQVTAYRRLVAANDWGAPLSFGSSLSAFLYGRDDGFYYRSWGGEVTRGSLRGEGLSWRLFGEQQSNADVKTRWSLAKAANDIEFIDNIVAPDATEGGATARYVRTFGLDPAGWRLLTDVRAEAAAGTFDYARGAMDLTVSHSLFGGLAAAITGSAGTSGGTLPTQRLWYLGGTQTVRGQSASPVDTGQVGNSFWMAHAELGTSFSGVRPVVFGDLGWAGDRKSWSTIGRPLSGAGVGLSFMDGLFRVDAARGIYPRTQTRLDLYVEARF